MNIGVDARNLITEISGISRYLIESVRSLISLGHEVTLYLPSPPTNKNCVPTDARVRVSNFPGPISRIIWGNTALPLMIEKAKHDVFWGPAHRLPWRPISTPLVVTIHDLVWHHAPATMTKRGLMAERVFFQRALKNADRIVSVSSATKDGVRELFPWAAKKIDVVYPGCTKLPAKGSSDILRKISIDRPFALFVGTLEPRKNLVRLLQAFASVTSDKKHQLLLVVAGKQGWGETDLKATIVQMGIQDKVRLTGLVTDDELADLYAAARFLTFPSLYEGFGLPIIEANSAGTPVLTSNNSSMPEVGGKAALLVDASDITSIASGIHRLCTDDALHAKLSDEAIENSERFDWNTNTAHLAEAFKLAIQSRNNLNEKVNV